MFMNKLTCHKLALIISILGECRTLWGEREQAMHCGIELLCKALPVKYQITVRLTSVGLAHARPK